MSFTLAVAEIETLCDIWAMLDQADTPPKKKSQTLGYTLGDVRAEALVDAAVDKLSKAKIETLVHTVC